MLAHKINSGMSLILWNTLCKSSVIFFLKSLQHFTSEATHVSSFISGKFSIPDKIQEICPFYLNFKLTDVKFLSMLSLFFYVYQFIARVIIFC